MQLQRLTIGQLTNKDQLMTMADKTGPLDLPGGGAAQNIAL